MPAICVADRPAVWVVVKPWMFCVISSLSWVVLRAPSWVAVMLGQGVVPEEYEPIADALDEEKVASALEQMRIGMLQTAERLLRESGPDAVRRSRRRDGRLLRVLDQGGGGGTDQPLLASGEVGHAHVLPVPLREAHSSPAGAADVVSMSGSTSPGSPRVRTHVAPRSGITVAKAPP